MWQCFPVSADLWHGRSEVTISLQQSLLMHLRGVE